MTKKKQVEEPLAINLRVSAATMAAIDRVAGVLSERARGMQVTRINALRTIVELGIKAIDEEDACA